MSDDDPVAPPSGMSKAQRDRRRVTASAFDAFVVEMRQLVALTKENRLYYEALTRSVGRVEDRIGRVERLLLDREREQQEAPDD